MSDAQRVTEKMKKKVILNKKTKEKGKKKRCKA
jgi:hypothetical protein